MRKLVCVALLLGLVGCQNTVGPFGYRPPQRVDDPSVSIAEQKRRGRDRLPFPDDTPNLLPDTQFTYPGMMGR